MARLTIALTLLLGLGAAAPVAVAQPAPTVGQRTLRQGDQGADVRALQVLLARHGHAISADGDFGPRTEAAVVAFQRSKGLAADGVVGARTRAALGSAGGASVGGGASGGTAGLDDRIAGRVGTVTRPTPSSSASQARAAGLTWARQARAANKHTLVIAFEGLWSYSPRFVKKLYAHQNELGRGRPSSPPRRGSMSFVSKNLLGPTLQRFHRRAELLVLPETSEKRSDSVALNTILAWKSVHGARLKLVLVGHSFGAYSALRLARKLEARSVAVKHMLLVDARTTPGSYRHFTRPGNVGSLHVYFQKGFMPGYPVTGADLNKRLRGTSHGDIPGASPVRARFLSLLE